MARLLASLIAGLIAATALAQATDKLETSAKKHLVACAAVVLEIKAEAWSLENERGGTVARGNYAISIRIIGPPTYAGRVRRMGVYQKEDLKVDGRLLRVGDSINFAASQSVLDQAVEPDVFSNLRQVSLRKKRKANQVPEPTAASGRGSS